MIVGVIAVVALLINGIVGRVATTPARADTSCAVSTILVNSCRPWLGATANNYPQTAADMQSQIQYHEQRIGRPLDIVHSYHPTGSNNLTPADLYFASRPQTMLLTDWNPTDTWGNISNQNAAIDQMAASIKSLGATRIMLDLWHEPENDVSPGGDSNCPSVKYKGSAGTVADYRNMWQYTRARFTADGVNNVVWLMDYVNIAAFDCLVPDLWPGNSLVDWVVFNAYDNATVGDFTSPVNRFMGVLNAANSATDNFASKPWGIVEWGSAAATPALDISFYDSAKAALDNNTFPQLKAYIVYDSDGGSVPANKDLRVAYDANHTPDDTKASHYYAFAGDPLLSGNYTLPPPPPDITAPTVTLNSPVDGSPVSGSVAVTGTTADDRAVSSVKLLVDGQDSGLTATQPDGSPSLTWDSATIANGSHTLQLAASDAAGNVGKSATITVTVANTDSQPPTAPSALSATAAGPTEVDLTWHPATDNVGVDHYVVYRDGALIGQTADSSTSYADTTVVASTSYSYRVLAMDAAGNPGPLSGSSTTVTPAVRDVTAPTVPSNLAASPVSASEVDLSWTASTDDTGVTGYNVYRDGGKVATVPSGPGASGTSWADTGLAEASTHAYVVTALDAAGNESGPSTGVNATTDDVTAPSTPTGLAAAPSDHSVQLTWHPASDNVAVAGYYVYRGSVVVATVTSGTTYLDSGLDEGVQYAYSVSAFDAAGNVGSRSTAVIVTTVDHTPPAPPTHLSTTVVDPNEVDLSWTAATDDVAVTGYDVYRDGTLLATLGRVTSYDDASVNDGSSYTYTVDAFDAAGNVSTLSSPATASTPDVSAPSVPGGVTATASTATTVNVSWSAATDNVGVTGYNVYRNGSKVATVTGTSYADTGLTNGMSYSYTVVAFDAAGNLSGASAPATATTTDTTAPSVPIGVSATATGGTTVNVSWSAATDNIGVAGYYLYRNAVRVATLTGTSYSDTGLTSFTSYKYTVSAYDAAGNVSGQSAAVTVQTADTTAPSAPSGLKATASGGSTVNLSWVKATDNVGVTGYKVYRNTVLVATVTGLSYADTGLTGGTAYSYTVAAFDAAGNVSALSAPATASTADTVPPTVPAGVTATASGGTTVNLAWSAATDNVRVVGYYVYRNGVKIATVTGTSYANTGLTNATTYSYTISAYDGAGNVSGQSTAAVATTADTAAPSVPAKPTVTARAYNQVSVTWTASTDNVRVAGYQVYRTGTLIATVVGATSYVDATVAARTTYSYTVGAYDAAGNKSKQSVASPVTTPAPPDTTAPTVPTTLKSTFTSAKAVYLSWTASTDNVGVAGYWVFRNGVYLGPSTKANYTDSTAVQATTYSYTVSAYDAAGNASAQSAPLSVAVPDATAPTAPSGLRLTPGTKSMAVAWVASTDNVAVVGYYLYRNGVKVATVKTGTTYADKSLATGTSYSYYVVAFDAANNLSPASATVSAVPK